MRVLTAWLAALLCLLAAGVPAQLDLKHRDAAPFRIHYEAAYEGLAQDTAHTLHEALADFGPYLDAGETPIDVVIATSPQIFTRFAGARFDVLQVNGIARTEGDKALIMVKGPGLRTPGSDYVGTLRHELVHVMLARSTDVSILPRWLNEGLAMMLANEYYWQSRWRMAQALARRTLIPYDRIDAQLRQPGHGVIFSDAYAQSLAMTQFLRDRYGEEALWSIVRDIGAGDSFPQALKRRTGLSEAAFFGHFEGSLWYLGIFGVITGASSSRSARCCSYWPTCASRGATGRPISACAKRRPKRMRGHPWPRGMKWWRGPTSGSATTTPACEARGLLVGWLLVGWLVVGLCAARHAQ